MLFHPESRSLLLQVRDPFQIRELIPQSRLVALPDYNIAVKYTLDAARVLRNLGHEVPSPIQSEYNWPGRRVPWVHQRAMAEARTIHKRMFDLSDMGTGKTSATLWAADYLMQTGVIRKVLILSPLSTIERVWMQDIFEVLMHRVASLVYGSAEARLDALKVDASFYVMNHDGITIPKVHAAIRKRPDIDLIVVDEGSMFRNASTEKWKALKALLRPDHRLWWLTATPTPNAPTDAWAQAKLVNPSRVPEYFGQFKRQTMRQVTQYKWVPQINGHNIAYEAMQPAVRFIKAECLDLPPVTFEDRQADLTPQQREMFNSMRLQMQIEARSTQITAVNAADKVNKIRQIFCGAIKDPETNSYITIPHKPRLKVLLETIEQAQAKVIVVVPFKGILHSLVQEVGKHHSVEMLNGDVTVANRNRIIKQFKEQPDPRVLLCHPKVMSHGLNLTEADMLIFYAPIYSNDEAQQVKERFNRAGQTRKMTIVKIACHPIEWGIYKVLDDRSAIQESVLSLYKKITA